VDAGHICSGLQCGGEMGVARTGPRAGHRLFERYAAGEVLLIAPDILLAEFASLVAKRHRRKQISAKQAHEAFSLMTKCAPRLFDMRPRLFRALDLSLRFQLSLWDCVYLALALEHNCPVLTADLRLFRAGKSGHPSVRMVQ